MITQGGAGDPDGAGGLRGSDGQSMAAGSNTSPAGPTIRRVRVWSDIWRQRAGQMQVNHELLIGGFKKFFKILTQIIYLEYKERRARDNLIEP